jgi:hypothetical protein
LDAAPAEDGIPGRLVARRLPDLPIGNAPPARYRAPWDCLVGRDALVGRRVDMDVAQAVGRLVEAGGAEMAHTGAAEPCASKEAIPQPIVTRVDPGGPIAARTVDSDL